jgi:hypothetical protein
MVADPFWTLWSGPSLPDAADHPRGFSMAEIPRLPPLSLDTRMGQSDWEPHLAHQGVNCLVFLSPIP